MNLKFERHPSHPEFERADVTKAMDFWKAYRKTAKEQLQPKIAIETEQRGNHIRYFAVRRVVTRDTDSASALDTYTVRNSAHLLPYQPRAVAHLCACLLCHNAAFDGSDTGTGKTYTALAVAREFGLSPAIVCLNSAQANWYNACLYMGVKPKFIVNWEFLRSKKFPFTRRQYIDELIWINRKKLYGSILIFDESHMGSGLRSLQGSIYVDAKHIGIPTLSLSATPAERPDQLANLFSVLGIVKTPKDFIREVEEGNGFYDEYDKLQSLCLSDDMEHYHKIIYPAYGYRIRSDDPDVVSHFPHGHYFASLVTIKPAEAKEQNKLYAHMIMRVEELKEAGRNAEAMVENLRYRQITELYKAQPLAEIARTHIAEGKQVVIFVNFSDTLFTLSKLLKTRSLIYGAQHTHGIDRVQVMNDFQNGTTRLIICNINAGGTSINLHDVNGTGQRVALLCPTYRATQLKQAMGRVRRANSKTEPIIKLVYAGNTIETEVAQRVNERLNAIDTLNDGILNNHDVFNLLGAGATDETEI